MTETEKKALALVNEVKSDWNNGSVTSSYINRDDCRIEALCRAIEREEATEARHAAELREQAERFSEVLGQITDLTKQVEFSLGSAVLARIQGIAAPFILPAPDPLVEVFDECFHQDVEEGETWSKAMARKARTAIEARGGKIVWETGE